jgi:hypothetical protein
VDLWGGTVRDGTVNSTSDYTLWTLYRSYFKGISANVELLITKCWRKRSGRRPVVTIIAESLSQLDEEHVVPTPLSGIWVKRRRLKCNCITWCAVDCTLIVIVIGTIQKFVTDSKQYQECKGYIKPGRILIVWDPDYGTQDIWFRGPGFQSRYWVGVLVMNNYTCSRVMGVNI